MYRSVLSSSTTTFANMLFTARVLLCEAPSGWGWNGVVRVFQTSRKLPTSSIILADRFFP